VTEWTAGVDGSAASMDAVALAADEAARWPHHAPCPVAVVKPE
jgi:hypothetical protein